MVSALLFSLIPMILGMKRAVRNSIFKFLKIENGIQPWNQFSIFKFVSWTLGIIPFISVGWRDGNDTSQTNFYFECSILTTSKTCTWWVYIVAIQFLRKLRIEIGITDVNIHFLKSWGLIFTSNFMNSISNCQLFCLYKEMIHILCLYDLLPGHQWQLADKIKNWILKMLFQHI